MQWSICLQLRSPGRFVDHSSCERCGSSDAKANYDNGTAFCFSCRAYYGSKGEPSTRQVDNDYQNNDELLEANYSEIRSRGLNLSTCQKYGYSVYPAEAEQAANYHDARGVLVAQKIKSADKSFRWIGRARDAGLFGQQLWAAGGRRIVITEGEIDAMSVAQAMGLTWPAVSIKNGAQGARQELAKHIEYLESFGEIVLMFDMDEPGRKAAAECAELFSPGKCKIAQLPVKDASDMLQAGRVKELVSAVYQAKSFRPDGLIEGCDLWGEVIRKPEAGLAYPWPCLNKLLHGQRQREMICWTGGTGIGKTQLLREVAFDLVHRHEQRIGYIALEESTRDVALGQMSLAAQKRLHLPHVRETATEEELRRWFEATLGTGRYLLCDPQWVQPEQILARIRYMVLGGECRWIFFDHISMTVGADAANGDERKRLDELVYKLCAMKDELGFGVHYITHLRKKEGTPYEEGGRVSLSDFRGSGAIAQVATAAIAAERDQQAGASEDRNITTLRVLKNRFSGETAVAGEVEFSTETGRISERQTRGADAVQDAINRLNAKREGKPKADF